MLKMWLQLRANDRQLGRRSDEYSSIWSEADRRCRSCSRNNGHIFALTSSIAWRRHLGPIVEAALGLTLMACGGQELSPVGVSPPHAIERTSDGADGGATEPLPVPLDFRSHMTRVSERFLSRGHGERFDAIIWANELARSASDAGPDLADGAIFVEEAIVRDTRGDRTAGLLVMVKESDSFHFDAIDADGHLASRERVAGCVTCHGEAKGSLFPWLAPQ